MNCLHLCISVLPFSSYSDLACGSLWVLFSGSIVYIHGHWPWKHWACACERQEASFHVKALVPCRGDRSRENFWMAEFLFFPDSHCGFPVVPEPQPLGQENNVLTSLHSLGLVFIGCNCNSTSVPCGSASGFNPKFEIHLSFGSSPPSSCLLTWLPTWGTWFYSLAMSG